MRSIQAVVGYFSILFGHLRPRKPHCKVKVFHPICLLLDQISHHTMAEIPDLEIPHGSFRRKLRKRRFRFEERWEDVAAAR
jgi:hypothetical protein